MSMLPSLHTAKSVRETSEGGQLGSSTPYGLLTGFGPLPITTCFSSMGHALAEQRFGSYEDVKISLDESFALKREDLQAWYS